MQASHDQPPAWIEWPEQARFSRTLERQRHLDRLLADPALQADELIRSSLEAPIFSTDYRRRFGTVYTAAYRPAQGGLALHWREGEAWRHPFPTFRVNRRPVRYAASHLGSGEPVALEALRGLLEQSEATTDSQDWPLPLGFALALADGIARGEVRRVGAFRGALERRRSVGRPSLSSPMTITSEGRCFKLLHSSRYRILGLIDALEPWRRRAALNTSSSAIRTRSGGAIDSAAIRGTPVSYTE